MNFYTADLHIGHANVIRFDNRPFSSVDEMLEVLVERWNAVVKQQDTVYILGDFIWRKENQWAEIVPRFTGSKVLIRGNHDPRKFSSEVSRLFQDIKNYKEITDDSGGKARHVIMCHYPIPFYKRDYDPDSYMLCGHVHNTHENDYLEAIRKSVRTDPECVDLGQIYNVGCMMPWMDYTPRTLDEIIAAHAEGK